MRSSFRDISRKLWTTHGILRTAGTAVERSFQFSCGQNRNRYGSSNSNGKKNLQDFQDGRYKHQQDGEYKDQQDSVHRDDTGAAENENDKEGGRVFQTRRRQM